MLTDQANMFTDDDIRAAVRLLEKFNNNVDAAVSAINLAASLQAVHGKQLKLCFDILDRTNNEASFAEQLLIFTDSFRGILGLPSSKQPVTIDASEAGPQNRK